ncbi:MAG: hypothetical protein GTN76_12715 [Candidatus Aenigmarchaeota archaeon]|nr:hypothetical protein [Candidatus Aenigmarchaeota archaeon]
MGDKDLKKYFKHMAMGKVGLDFKPVSLYIKFFDYVQDTYPVDVKVVDVDFLELAEDFKDYYEANFLDSGKLGKIEVEEEEIPGSDKKLIKVREIRYDKDKKDH